MSNMKLVGVAKEVADNYREILATLTFQQQNRNQKNCQGEHEICQCGGWCYIREAQKGNIHALVI